MIGAHLLNLIALIRQGHEVHISPSDDASQLVGELYVKTLGGSHSVRCVIAQAFTLEALSGELLAQWESPANGAGRQVAGLDSSIPKRLCRDAGYCNSRRLAGEMAVLCPYCDNISAQLQLWDSLPIGAPNAQPWSGQ